MVATKLSEVAGKGWEWYSGDSANDPSRQSHPDPTSATPKFPSSSSTPNPSMPSYWDLAQESVQNVFEQTYSAVTGAVSSVYLGSPPGSDAGDELPVMENLPITPRKNTNHSLLASQKLLNLFHNPYISVRGGGRHRVNPPSSMEAVRSFLSVVPSGQELNDQASEASSSHTDSLEGSAKGFFWHAYNFDRSRQQYQTVQNGPTSISASPSETASQLAEGTVRAFRDLALDEAVELHEALRYWSYRWERPILSWVEAGPTVWFSEEGYRHQEVGRKVSQIQAVLARRCAAIGDLQQHLLRAGWQRGVAQWGVLGDGGEWATVTGVDGRMPAEGNDDEVPRIPFARRASSEILDNIPPPGPPPMPKCPPSNVSQLPQRSRHDTLYYTKVFVKNNDGGRIYIDDPALAEWSVDAMSIVRRQLYRAANGHVMLPCAENWSEGDDQSISYDHAGSLVLDSEINTVEEKKVYPKLPLWASLKSSMSTVDEEDEDDGEEGLARVTDQRVTISNLPMMVSEVSELLDSMEGIMEIQRARRLEKLRAPLWIRRNWYISAIIFPPLSYFFYKFVGTGDGLNLMKITGQSLSNFFHEHVVEPFLAIYDELTKGTENISDREARNIAIENLKKMIRSWLDETHPNMPLEERKRMADAMDISLIEARKEESMKTIYELNSVIRMSLIEAQFLKKEMMNALLALDEMRASTNFNMNIAAITPFVMMVYMAKRTFQFIYYAMLKMGKSREETYGSFLHILTEIERLLVMRDNPPMPITQGGNRNRTATKDVDALSHVSSDTVLNADDLGMLMLHIHELKTILWKDRRRFPPSIIRSVAEDLAELAGERGAVSVRQQLQIIGRMCRTYPFLKVMSSAMIFEYLQL